MKSLGLSTDDLILGLAERNLAARKLGPEFKRTFSVSLDVFWDAFTGFDVIKFDEWIKVPDGASTSNHIKKKYGKQAEQLVRRMLA